MPSVTRRQLFTFFQDALRNPGPTPSPDMLPEFLRPPGALEEDRFLKACTRCDDCAQACPYDVILPLGPAYGTANGTPAILPRDRACRLCEDLPCAQACPSGALRVIPTSQVRMGTARLDESLCWAAMGQPCDYCVGECPVPGALQLNDGRVQVDEASCTGCGMCVQICTATPSALNVELKGSK